jgi:hypothetical protein
VCASDLLTIRQRDNEWLFGGAFVKTCRIAQDVVSGCSRVEDGWFVVCNWWGTSGRINVFGNCAYFINLCFLTRPETSDLWFTNLASAHVVASGCFFLVAGGSAGAGFTVVGRTHAIPMGPTVSVIIDDAWWALWLLTDWLADQRNFRFQLLLQVFQLSLEHGNELLHVGRVVVVTVCRCGCHEFRHDFDVCGTEAGIEAIAHLFVGGLLLA